MHFKRTLEDTVLDYSKKFPIVYLEGPCKVGKASLLKQIKDSKITTVSLKSLSNRELAQTNPTLFLQKYKSPLIIEDIHLVPQLFTALKCAVDKDKKAGQYFLTSSVQFNRLKIDVSMEGTIAIVKLQGLSQEEKLSLTSSKAFIPTKAYLDEKELLLKDKACSYLFHELWKGSNPALYSLEDECLTKFYDSYLQDYLCFEVHNYFKVKDEVEFFRFLKFIASKTSQVINYTAFANEFGISNDQLKKWLSILVDSGIVFLQPAYYRNLPYNAIKTPKLHFFDLGLACYLLSFTSSNIVEDGPLKEALVKSYVVSEIVKSYYHRGQTPNLYYYQDKEQREIDVLLEEDGLLYPMVIKSKSNPNKDDIRHFEVIDKVLKVPRGCGAVLCRASSYLPLTKQDYLVPISYI